MTLPGNTNSAATAALKSATNDLHRQVERAIDWQAWLGSAEEYEQFLREISRFLTPADQRLERFFGDTEDWIATRRTAESASADLHDLVLLRTGSEQEAVSAVEAIDKHAADELYTWIERPPQAAGVLYVLEGSTMGSVHLCKLVTARVDLADQVPVRFLSAYQDETENRWQATKNWLDRFLQTETEVNEAIEAACRMFRIYGEQLGHGK